MRRIVGRPWDPWERWAAIHAGELLPDGRPRFRRVIIIVARQNGKTELCVGLSLYWQFVEAVPMILGTSTKLDYAKVSWEKATALAEAAPELAPLRPKRWKRDANGEQESWTVDGSKYKIAAANDNAGRSLTVHKLICDELRQHATYRTWNAAYNAMNAVRDGQAFGITNMGDDSSLVLNDLRAAALKFIESAEGDPRLGLFEWSCLPGDDPLDVRALAKANPNLNRPGRIEAEDLLGQAATAVLAGGDALVGFKTEVMCIRVPNLNPAVDADAFGDCFVGYGLDAVRDRVAVVLDVSPDLQHVALYAGAVLPDGRVLVDLVADWSGDGCTTTALDELAALLARVRARAFGWFPSGPAAALAAKLADRTKSGRRGWPPAGTKVEAIRGEVAAVCMGFAEQVATRRLAHTGDPLLVDQATKAEKLLRGNTWVFAAPPGRHVNAVYAAAGAAHLARTLPTSPGAPRLLTIDDDE